MQTYLITGGAGFIGSSLSEELIKEGNKVVAIDNFCDFYNPTIKENNVKELIKNSNFKLYRNDIRDRETVKRIFEENNIDIAILCIPKNGAQDVVDRLVNAGVKGIWNFAPIDLDVPKGVIVENVNLTESLFTLSYLMKENE